MKTHSLAPRVSHQPAMPSTQKPNYQVYTIPLDGSKGALLNGLFTMDFETPATTVTMVGAVDVNGNQSLGAQVFCALDRALGDPIPMHINTEIHAPGGLFSFRLSWPAQANTFATFFVSDDVRGNGVRVLAPPTTQLVTTSTGSQLNQSRITVGNIAVQLDATSNPQSRTIRNLDSGMSVWLGQSNAVTVGNGFELEGGDEIVITDTRTPIWAIATSAGPSPTVQIEVAV